jgi:hypothetical protein
MSLPAEILHIIADETNNQPIDRMYMRKVCKWWRKSIPMVKLEKKGGDLRSCLTEYIMNSDNLLNTVNYMEKSPMCWNLCSIAYIRITDVVVNAIECWGYNIYGKRVDMLVELLKSRPEYIDTSLSSTTMIDRYNQSGFAYIYSHGTYSSETNAIRVLYHILMKCYDGFVVQSVFRRHLQSYRSVSDITKLINYCWTNCVHYNSDKMVLLMKLLIDHCGYKGGSYSTFY